MNAPAPVRTLIVDDEPLARERLRRHLAAHDDFALAGEAASVAEAVAEFRRLAPDLVLLDVRLPDGSGFDVLDRIGAEDLPLVVFVTAYDDRAVLAFEANAVDYLLKPFTPERFAAALARVRRLLDTEARAVWAERVADAMGPGGEAPLERLVVRERDRFRLVPVGTVEWLRSAGNYVEFRADGRTHLVRRTLGELERALDPRAFVRIHRTAIVARDRVREIRRTDGEAFEVEMAGGDVLPMSRTHAPALLGRER